MIAADTKEPEENAPVDIGNSTRGDEGILEGAMIGEIDENISDSDEEDDGMLIHVSKGSNSRKPLRKSIGKANTYQRHHGFGETIGGQEQRDGASEAVVDELKRLRFLRHVSAFDVDINALEDHPWRSKTVDLFDYFNYGFNERTWMQYCLQQLRLRAQKGQGPYQAPTSTSAKIPDMDEMSSAHPSSDNDESHAFLRNSVVSDVLTTSESVGSENASTNVPMMPIPPVAPSFAMPPPPSAPILPPLPPSFGPAHQPHVPPPPVPPPNLPTTLPPAPFTTASMPIHPSNQIKFESVMNMYGPRTTHPSSATNADQVPPSSSSESSKRRADSRDREYDGRSGAATKKSRYEEDRGDKRVLDRRERGSSRDQDRRGTESSRSGGSSRYRGDDNNSRKSERSSSRQRTDRSNRRSSDRHDRR